MKKFWSLAVVFALVFSLTSISAYAAGNDGMNAKQSRASDSMNNNMNNYRTNDDGTNEFRANNTNDFRANNMTNNQAGRYNAYSNHYRATAVDNNKGNNWGWLGLLGLTGLFGLRSRSREHT